MTKTQQLDDGIKNMKKFLPFSRRQPSLDRYTVNRGGWSGSDKLTLKSTRRTSAISLNTQSIQVVRGAYNIDLNKVDSSFTKLHRACLLNDITQVKKHIHKVNNNSHDSSNRYPIHLATINGNFAIVKLLIENRANPNVQDNEENTPLIKSIECGHESLVKYLLSNGADPNLSDLQKNTALHWAILTKSRIAIDALLSSKKCDLSLKNNKGETCLHLAVKSPLKDSLLLESLIRAGSDLAAKDQHGLTALDIAQKTNNEAAINTFNICQDNRRDSSDITIVQELPDNNGTEFTATEICEEYKLRYAIKNRENLEYEKRLIQLNAQIERLKVDMSFMREQNERLESDYKKLSDENSKLKIENSNLLEQINKNKLKNAETEPTKNSENHCNKDLEKVESVECRGLEEFLAERAFLKERATKLKYELATIQH